VTNEFSLYKYKFIKLLSLLAKLLAFSGNFLSTAAAVLLQTISVRRSIRH